MKGQQPEEPLVSCPDTAGKLVVLGAINGVFGVQGWNKVYSDTVPRENIVGYRVWYLSDSAGPAHTAQQGCGGQSSDNNNWSRFEVAAGRLQGKNVVVKLSGVDDRDAASILIGCQVAVQREQLPTLSGDEYYWSDLLGFKVQDIQGDALGVLDRLFETGANDVMVLHASTDFDRLDTSQPLQEILVPWIRDSVVKNVDLQERVIVVDWDPDF